MQHALSAHACRWAGSRTANGTPPDREPSHPGQRRRHAGKAAPSAECERAVASAAARLFRSSRPVVVGGRRGRGLGDGANAPVRPVPTRHRTRACPPCYRRIGVAPAVRSPSRSASELTAEPPWIRPCARPDRDEAFGGPYACAPRLALPCAKAASQMGQKRLPPRAERLAASGLARLVGWRTNFGALAPVRGSPPRVPAVRPGTRCPQRVGVQGHARGTGGLA